VLPFADMSPAHDQEYFADGIAEEILNALAHVDGVRVPGRTSSFFFKGKSVKLADIGRELRVGTVLQGSVRKEGNRVRITAQLVRVDDETSVWSETFDREMTGVFAVQDDIANAVVKALKVRLPPGSAPTPPRAMPSSPEAYAQYLLGRHLFFTRWSSETLPKALDYLERAVALDPEYAPAWAFLSITITQLAVLDETATPEKRERASRAAEKAIELAPDESAGYVARAYLRNFLYWDWAGAKADCERALAGKTSHVNPHNQYSLLLGTLGRNVEAIAFARQATDLDPLNTPYWSNLGLYYTAAGELDLARAALMRSIEIVPGNSRGTLRLGIANLLGNSPGEALRWFERLPEGPVRLAAVAIANRELGREPESRLALQALLAQHGSHPYRIAEVHAWYGENDEAFAWLERAYDQRSVTLNQIKLDPFVYKVRKDPRYAALLRRMNLPVD
jgi:TolB-like protein/tetratricopeptide (TPR) repeat protein